MTAHTDAHADLIMATSGGVSDSVTITRETAQTCLSLLNQSRQPEGADPSVTERMRAALVEIVALHSRPHAPSAPFDIARAALGEA